MQALDPGEIVGRRSFRRQGVQHGFMQRAKIFRILRCAVVAQIVQIIADRLIDDDKLNGLLVEVSGQQAAESASLRSGTFWFQCLREPDGEVRDRESGGLSLSTAVKKHAPLDGPVGSFWLSKIEDGLVSANDAPEMEVGPKDL